LDVLHFLVDDLLNLTLAEPWNLRMRRDLKRHLPPNAAHLPILPVFHILILCLWMPFITFSRVGESILSGVKLANEALWRVGPLLGHCPSYLLAASIYQSLVWV